LPLPTRYLTARDVLRFRDDAFAAYYTSPGYLKMVEEKFGKGTVAEIRAMTAVRLERDLLTGKLDVPPTLLPRERRPAAGPPLISLSQK
jgi:hypothetical protein